MSLTIEPARAPTPATPPARSPVVPGMLRPFTLADLGPAPPGWVVGPPDFIGVGTGKAGSSWWYELLRAHPQVVPNRLGQKELHYLCHFGLRPPSAEAIATCRQAFARPPGAVCGEWSGNILQHPLAVTVMKEMAPEARLLALVRNPVDRAVSALNQFLSARASFMGLDGDRRAVFETFSLFPEAMHGSLLARAFHDILDHWPRERILVLQYEVCRADPLAALRRTWAFLGIGDASPPPGLRRPVNRRAYLVDRPGPAERARIARWFHRDVDELLSLFPELDRRAWPDFL